MPPQIYHFETDNFFERLRNYQFQSNNFWDVQKIVIISAGYWCDNRPYRNQNSSKFNY